MGITQFSARTRIMCGPDGLTQLGAEFATAGVDRVAVVVDRGVAQSGLLDRILGEGHVNPVSVGLVDPDPDVATAEQLSRQALAAEAQAVLAIGGGSGLCAAKAVAIRLRNDGPLTAYEGVGRVPHPPTFTIAVPTTAGSGSEVSNALVLHEPGRDKEIVVRGPGCEPAIAVLDASVLTHLPRTPMLYAALDALTHGLEALWTLNRNSITDALAGAAVDIILDTLPAALAEREPATLQSLLEASTMANLACGNTGLGLVHALSSAPSVSLPHGYQNGVLLLPVARFNSAFMDPVHRGYIERVEKLFHEVEFTGHFGPGEFGRSEYAAVLAASDQHPFRLNNARPSTNEDVSALLHSAGFVDEKVPA